MSSPSSSSSSSAATGFAAQPQDADTKARLAALRQELQAMSARLGDLEADAEEHALVVKTVGAVEPTRRCHRLMSGVLVERTAAEVLPALETNLANLKSTIDSFAKQFAEKEAAFLKMQSAADSAANAGSGSTAKKTAIATGRV